MFWFLLSVPIHPAHSCCSRPMPTLSGSVFEQKGRSKAVVFMPGDLGANMFSWKVLWWFCLTENWMVSNLFCFCDNCKNTRKRRNVVDHCLSSVLLVPHLFSPVEMPFVYYLLFLIIWNFSEVNNAFV